MEVSRASMDDLYSLVHRQIGPLLDRSRTALAKTELRRGLAAGTAGMAAMGATKLALTGTDETHGWDDAPPAAKLAKRMIEALSDRAISARHVGKLNNAMHVAYGPAIGVSFRLAQKALPGGIASSALAFAAVVWGVRLVILPLFGLRKPFWTYSFKANALDGSYHLVYGVVVAAVHEALEPKER